MSLPAEYRFPDLTSSYTFRRMQDVFEPAKASIKHCSPLVAALVTSFVIVVFIVNLSSALALLCG